MLRIFLHPVTGALAAAFFLLSGCATTSLPPAEAVAEAPRGTWRAVSLHESARVAGEPRPSDDLRAVVENAVAEALEEVGGGYVAEDEVWAAVIDVRDPWDPRIGAVQGDDPVYPASVIKICYMVAAYDLNRTMGLPLDDAMRADIRDMIVVSDNKATNRVLDRITNTGFGPELEGDALASFIRKRLALAEYFDSIGTPGLDPGMKTYSGGISLYGRDRQQLGGRAGDNYEGSNMMTASDTARLLYLVWRGAVVDREACEEMLAVMERDADNTTYLSNALPEGATLYSKSGWTGLTRHDAGVIALPEGGALIVAVFSKIRNLPEGEKSPRIIEAVTERVLADLRAEAGMLDQATADESAALDQLGENSL